MTMNEALLNPDKFVKEADEQAAENEWLHEYGTDLEEAWEELDD